MKDFEKFDKAVQQEIRSTERYYREQIFSSGCSSLVPIFRINAFNLTVELLIRQLNGSPYIQKGVQFSEKTIETMLDIDIYQYRHFHFFFIGDAPNEVENFVVRECSVIHSISELVESELWAEQPSWCNFEKDIPKLVSKYPALKPLDLVALSQQIFSLVKDLDLPSTIKGHMEMYTTQPEWRERFFRNQCSLYYMLEIANYMDLSDKEKVYLACLGMIKDIGYVRLSAQLDNFEVMHPLVSYQLLEEMVSSNPGNGVFNQDLITSVLVHHEFTDGSGPLSRMRHPLVTKQLAAGIPKIAQISGVSDLYFGFLNDYSPTLAFAITCGFFVGAGELTIPL